MSEAAPFPAETFERYLPGIVAADAGHLAAMATIIGQEWDLQARPGMTVMLDDAADKPDKLRRFLERKPPQASDMELTADEAPLPPHTTDARLRKERYEEMVLRAKQRKLEAELPYYDLRMRTGRVALQVHASRLADRVTLETTPQRGIIHPTAVVRHAITDPHGTLDTRLLLERLSFRNLMSNDARIQRHFKHALLTGIATYAVSEHRSAVH